MASLGCLGRAVVDLMRRFNALQIAAGFTAAVLLNGLFLAAFLLETVSPRWTTSTESAPPVQLLLHPLPATTPPLKSAKSRETHPPPPSQPSTGRPRTPTNTSPTTPGPLLPQPSPIPPTTPASSPAATPGSQQDELSARTASALRHLGACSDFALQGHSEARCGNSWADEGADVDPLTPTARAAFAVERSDPDPRLQRSSAVRGALADHTGGGNNLHYGCTLKHGKVQCSTY